MIGISRYNNKEEKRVEINAKWGNVVAEEKRKKKEFISYRSDLRKNSYFNACEIENVFKTVKFFFFSSFVLFTATYKITFYMVS